jgi:predicted MFS family arabinose efflux permease
MAIAAAASASWMLGVGVGLAGLSTGLTSPPLASAVALRFEHKDRPRANGAINAGTAAGIVISGLSALAVGSAWRELYVLFAVIGGAVTAWSWLAMPADRPEGRSQGFSFGGLGPPGMTGLCFSSFLMGAASTAVWTFGAAILRDGLGFSERMIAGAWIVLGAAGVLGLATGVLTARFGVGRVHRAALLAMAIGTAGLAAASYLPLLAFAVMALFGAAYIVSSGALLIQGLALLPDRPDLGLGVPFLTIAVGQTVGAPLFGLVSEQTGALTAVLISAALACAATLWPCGRRTAVATE